MATAPSAKGSSSDELAPDQNIPTWEAGKVPLATGVGPLDAPFLTAFLLPEGKRTGASVIIAPAGANNMLMYGAEGLHIAERYNDWGARLSCSRLGFRPATTIHASGRRGVSFQEIRCPTGRRRAYRVVRGGSFFVEAFDLRAYARSAAWPSFQGHRMIGFRAVREP
jgi:hypothetical protein